MIVAVSSSTECQEWRCARCGGLMLEILAIGEGTLLRHKCRNCNTFNVVEKTDEGAVRFFTNLNFRSSTAVPQGVEVTASA